MIGGLNGVQGGGGNLNGNGVLGFGFSLFQIIEIGSGSFQLLFGGFGGMIFGSINGGLNFFVGFLNSGGSKLGFGGFGGFNMGGSF